MTKLWGQSVDQIAVEERVAMLGTRSIKKNAKLAGLSLAISCIDLTTLEGSDTSGKVESLCAKAVRPDYLDETIPHVAAVCVYPNLAPIAKGFLANSEVKVASVATGFPAGQVPFQAKLEDTRQAALFSDEIDMVINRGAFLSGDYEGVMADIAEIKALIGKKHLKVILETGELGSLSQVRKASFLAMEAGADFIKTSTGKIPSAATLPVCLVMMEAIRDYAMQTGKIIGFKPAGGIKTAKQALTQLVLVKETLGDTWLNADRFRIGASTVLNDILMQIRKEKSGCYQSVDDFSDA